MKGWNKKKGERIKRGGEILRIKRRARREN